ncbi:unnamed protein product [Camellia sinensis]
MVGRRGKKGRRACDMRIDAEKGRARRREVVVKYWYFWRKVKIDLLNILLVLSIGIDGNCSSIEFRGGNEMVSTMGGMYMSRVDWKTLMFPPIFFKLYCFDSLSLWWFGGDCVLEE